MKDIEQQKECWREKTTRYVRNMIPERDLTMVWNGIERTLTEPGLQRPRDDLRPRNLHSKLSLNKNIEGEMQHGKGHAPEDGLHDSIHSRGDAQILLLLFVLVICIRTYLTPQPFSLFPVRLIEEVPFLGEIEQGGF